ncbi:MAG: phosphatase PAP2 family protein [Phycisphaerae bacterium]|nr:phosphatase PAP2 family protein [Phycisphaerae bacterium]
MRFVCLLFGVLATALVATGCSGPGKEAMRAAMTKYELRESPQIALAPLRTPAGLPVRTDAAGADANWFALKSMQLAQNIERTVADDAAEPAYTPWRERRGPAYPGDFWRSFGRDVKELLPTVWDDTKATFTDPMAMIGFGLAGAAGIVINASGSDNCVANHFTRNGSQLNTFWDGVGDVGGNPGTHFAVAGAMYFTSLARSDVKTYEVSKTLINALSINGLTTLALKGLVRTRSPNGDPFGWPSGHTSSTFCFATVMYEAYGPWVGVPMMAFASYVGYERIDARNHDFSDVISGALIGVAIGHAVSQNHEFRIFGMDVLPYINPERGVFGLALGKQW